MAKDLADEDDDKFESMDEESLSFLEQVRKGKARNFVLSMKGNKVRSMIVKKKPIKEKDRKAAKGEGYQPVYGVVTGTGAKISFSIARSDGFDERAADRKTEKLKKFLNEQTGKAFKPAFELVDTPPAIAFDDEDLTDPLIARFMKLEPAINQARDTHSDSIPLIQTSVTMIRGLLQDDETRASAGPKIDELEQYLSDLLAGSAAIPPAPPPPPGTGPAPAPAAADPAATFKARLAALVPKIKEAVGTAAGNDAKLKASEAGVFARKQDFAQAEKLLDEAESLLQGDSASATASPPGDDPARSAKLAEALKRLKPLVDKVINADENRKGELHATMAQIAGEIKGKQFAQATQNVTDFATQLKSLAAQLQAAADGDVDRMREFSARRDALEPRLLEAQKADREKAAKLGAVWDYANDQAQAGNFENAFKALDRLEQAVAGVLKTTAAKPTVPTGEQVAGSQAERTGTSVDGLGEFQQRWQSIYARVEEAKKANPDAANALDYSYQQANDLAESGNVSGANQSLDRLETQIMQALQSAPATDQERFGIREGIVAEQAQVLERFFAERVQAAKSETKSDVDKLENALAGQVAEEEMQGLAEAINEALDQLYDEVYDGLTVALAFESADGVLQAVEDARQTVRADSVVAQLQKAKSEAGFDPKVQDKFERLFQDVVNKVTEVAQAS